MCVCSAYARLSPAILQRDAAPWRHEADQRRPTLRWLASTISKHVRENYCGARRQARSAVVPSRAARARNAYNVRRTSRRIMALHGEKFENGEKLRPAVDPERENRRHDEMAR